MGEDEGDAGDVADSAGAGGDVLKGAPAAGEQGEPAFAQAAQGAEQRVAGAGIDIKVPPAGGLLRNRPAILGEAPRCRQSRFRSVHAADGPRAESPRASPDVDVPLLILAVGGDRAVDRCDWRDHQLPGKLRLRPRRPRVRMGAG
jgi:hypothetical protein